MRILILSGLVCLGLVRSSLSADGEDRPQAIIRVESPVTTVAFSPDGTLLAIGADDGSLRVWDVVAGRLRWSLDEKASGSVWKVAFSPDGRRLVAAWLWTGLTMTSAEGHEIRSSPGEHERCLKAGLIPSYRPKGNLSDVNLVDVGSGKILSRIATDGPTVSAVSFSSDGSSILIASQKGIVRRHVESGASLAVRAERDEVGKPMMFSAAGRYFLSMHPKRRAHLWEMLTGKECARADLPPGETWGLALSPNGRAVAAITIHHSVCVLDLPGGKQHPITTPFTGKPCTPGFVEVVRFAARSTRIAIALPDGTVQLADWSSGKAGPILRGATAPVRALAFSPDEKLLAAGGEDKSVRVWHLPRP